MPLRGAAAGSVAPVGGFLSSAEHLLRTPPPLWRSFRQPGKCLHSVIFHEQQQQQQWWGLINTLAFKRGGAAG